jgi:hypothetical protein
MKRLFLCGMLLLAGLPTIYANPDTTVTSFEIHLKRRSADYSLGFNTSSIDRLKIYNAVMQQIQDKLATNQIMSLHQPYVLLKFHEYLSDKESSLNHISPSEQSELDRHAHNYFIKVSGHLNTSTPLNPFAKSTFVLKVYVFDSTGKLIAKCKSRSGEKDLNRTDDSAEAITESAFLQMVSDAAMNLRLQI